MRSREAPAAPRDALDLRAIRDGGRREIPWETPEDPSLSAEARRLVGESWRARMTQEHLAVGAFSLLAVELAQVGCDSVVLALITRAAADEARHADVCRRLAVRHLGEAAVASRLRGVPTFAPHPGCSPEERALLHVVEMCCLNETFTGAYFTEMIERTTHPLARAAVESLLEDEIDHGRVGWAHLAAARRDGHAGVLDTALPALLIETVKPVMDEAAAYPDDDDPQKEAHAYLGTRAARAVYRRTLERVILPGFEALGVDTRAGRALSEGEGWFRG
jgi:hypothetical protein